MAVVRRRRLAFASLLLPLALVAARAGAGQPKVSQGGPLADPAATEIALRSWRIDVRAGDSAVDASLRARPEDAAASGEEIVLVKFAQPPTARQIAALVAASLRVYTYLPYHTYLVKVPAGFGAKEVAAIGASWSGPYHPAYKISPEIAAVAARPDATTALRPVMLHLYPDTDLAMVEAQLAGLGVKGVAGSAEGKLFSRVRLLLSDDEIAALREPLARVRDVFWIELEGRRTLLNDTTVWVGQSGLAGGQTTPIFAHGIHGEGQVVGILDTGIDPDMCYFRDPARGLPPTNACNGGTVIDPLQRKVLAADFLWTTECSGGIAGNEWDTHDHGTHVAGTVAGDNFANPIKHDTADGMAPAAKLVIQDGGLTTDNCADLPGIGCPVVDLNPIFQQAYDQGARIHTNSWGDNENAPVQNNYSAGSQDVDEFMWNHPDFLLFFAAGNSGPGTASVGSPSTAKSAVSVGATLRGTSAGAMASFSSCGPTADGRFKPEVTVPGSSIVSANNDINVTSNNCNTTSMSGTSMASPGAAGLTALIRQYYTEGWAGGFRNWSQGVTPSAALLRATLVNSAASMSGATAVPSNCQGWGRVLLDDALYFAGDARKLWARDSLGDFPNASSNETRTYSFIATAGQPLKVTLAWTDFPSTPAASINLVNDLDLEVVGPIGTLWRGNVFTGGASTTGGLADRRNTLEQVLLTAPAAGTYAVTVRSFSVPSGPQPFALVVSGDFVAP
jgi:subtilisin family serine protease